MTPEQFDECESYYLNHNRGWGVLPGWVLWIEFIVSMIGLAFFRGGWEFWTAFVFLFHSTGESFRRHGHKEGYFEGLRDGDELNH